MILNWLGMNSSKSNNTGDISHQILGTLLNAPLKKNQEEIVLGCGCFWGAEKGFWKLPGIITTAVGYAGGESVNPTYREVCSGITGHTEVVRVTWEKSEIDISDLLKLFWECHDPTQGNRQGNDSGTQYRSAIYTYNKFHYKIALESRDSYQKELDINNFGRITTEIKEYQDFFFAEDYHQQYLAKPGSRPYCSAMPTKVLLKDFTNANFKLEKEVWENYDWSINHCVLRSNNEPINKNAPTN